MLTRLPTYLSTYLPSIYLSPTYILSTKVTYLSTYFFTHLPIYYLSIYLLIYLPT
jgi:hypothetical protein